MSKSRRPLVALAAVLALMLVAAYWMAVRQRAGSHPLEEDLIDCETPQDEWEGAAQGSAGFPDVLRWQSTGTAGHLKTSYVSHGDLSATASDLVEHYQANEVCLLREATYLDALGNTWACLMEGPGWVDLCLVRENEQGHQTKVGILRMLRLDEAGDDAKDIE